MADPLEGGCHCGRIRYRLTGPIEEPCHCHCVDCRRAAGSPFVSWLTTPRTAFELVQGKLRIYASSERAERGFCEHCGSPLTFAYHAQPDRIDVTIASLDDPEAVVPESHLWTRRRLSWIRLADGLPEFDTVREPSSRS